MIGFKIQKKIFKHSADNAESERQNERFSAPVAFQFSSPGVSLSESRKELKALVTWQQMKFLLELAFIVLAKFKNHKDDKQPHSPGN